MLFHKFDKTMKEVKEDIENKANIVLVDVRFESEYLEGHIANAILLPLPQLEENADSLLMKNQTLYVYCRSGQRATKAVMKLKAMGYASVYNIGGMIYWPYEVEK